MPYSYDDDLDSKFEVLKACLLANQEFAYKLRGKKSPKIPSDEYFALLKGKFKKSRLQKKPSPPQTVPDEMVSLVLEHYFNFPPEDLEEAQKIHLKSMGAENFVGDQLERYIANIIEPLGWVWCSGSVIRACDFIKTRDDNTWRLLQIKNRSNSENSSSDKIRAGTDIEKWFRTYSSKKEKNWDNFPDDEVKELLSEEGFKTFVIKYLEEVVGE